MDGVQRHDIGDSVAQAAAGRTGWGKFTAVWLRIGALGFGGPAGQIALMHRELVERRGWVGEAEYLRAQGFCMLLPGPEAQQLATWCGWRLRGSAGGLVAGLAFVLPGAVIMAALTALYLAFGTLPLAQALLDGLQAAVLAVVAQALARIAGRALRGSRSWALAIAAFVALFAFQLPFPLVVAAAGLIGWPGGRGTVAPDVARSPVAWRKSAMTALTWAGVWALPVAAAAVWLGPDHALVTLGGFFARVAAFSFGGAYAALSYVAQAAVEPHGWLSPAEMLAGLGLAETTPGPLVLVFQFVGGLAGLRLDGPWSPDGGAALGMVMVLWVTFVPSFLWVFVAAPHLDRLTRQPALAAALAAITAAIVGVMANLALWFALHVLFERVEAVSWGALRTWLPAGDFDPIAALIATAALALLTRTRIGVVGVLALGATAGMIARYLNIG